jgi:exosortase
MEGSNSRSRAAPAILAVAAVAAIAATYAGTLVWLGGRWRTDPFYSHGPLVPLVSAWLLWKRRTQLAFAPAVGRSGVALLGGAAVLHLLGVRLSFEFLSCASIIAVLMAAALLAGGRPLARAAAFPMLYLLFAIPLPRIILEQVSLPMQLMSAAGAAGILRGLGLDVVRHGVELEFPGFMLAVADACSGLRSVITVLAISTLVAALTPVSPARKGLLVALSPVAAMAANVLRIAVTGLVGSAFGGRAAIVFFDQASGYFFFAVVLLLMIGIAVLLQGRRAEESTAAVTPPPKPIDVRALALKAAVPVFLMLGAAAAAGAALRPRPDPTASPMAGWRPVLEGWKVGESAGPPGGPGDTLVRGTLEGGGGPRLGYLVVHSLGGRYLHSPEACSVARGWFPERREVRELDIDGARQPIHYWVMKRGELRVGVAFWYVLGGAPARGSFDYHVKAVAQRLVEGRVDSAYGEVTSPLLEGEPASMEDRLVALAGSLRAQVVPRLWPGGPAR